MSTRRAIVLRGSPVILEDEIADAAITPGHLLKRTTTGFAKNTENNKLVPLYVAVERDELGKDVADAYAASDVVKVAALYPGCRAYMFIASGANIAKGDFLTGDTAGRLAAASTNPRLFVATEAVNNSAGPGDARIIVEAV
jgi:hypothetical protein